ncbi:MAG: hypothetical protein SF187_26375 [Deltaproteobacteria bacterium]|nr:hypothetical protein [Deltaproteobacteria bacterium]
MTVAKFQMYSSPQAVTRVERPKPVAAIASVTALLVLTSLAAWAMDRQVTSLLNQMDADTLRQSNALLAQFVEQQRRHLLSEVNVLAEDTRIRSTVITPELDEATITDVLTDLQKSSNASVLAVLDTRGKVRSVVGADEMRNLDLGSSSLVKAALENPSTYIWTFTNKVRVLGVAPIRTGDEVAALFMMGFELGESSFTGIEKALGAQGAVVVGDKVVSKISDNPSVLNAFRLASDLAEGEQRLVRSDRDYLASASPVSNMASAGKTVWLVPHYQHVERVGLLKVATWAPAVFMCITFAVVLWLGLRKANQEPA